jgi:hypothetical protein
MRIALFLILAGTALLYLSFQATSSTVKIITQPNGTTAMCMGSTALFEGRAGSFIMGTGCPDWKDAKPIALVTVEKPVLVYLGFALLTFGFLIQLLSVPSPKSLAQMRADVKAAEKEQKLAKRLAALKSNPPPKD